MIQISNDSTNTNVSITVLNLLYKITSCLQIHPMINVKVVVTKFQACFMLILADIHLSVPQTR